MLVITILAVAAMALLLIYTWRETLSWALPCAVFLLSLALLLMGLKAV